MKQLIISIGREFGSAGHEIAGKLAEHYGLPLYDQNLLDEIADERNLDSQSLKEFDETKQNKFFYRTVRGMNSSPQANVARMQFEFLREKAESGESFVIVGRCAETVLKDYAGMISVFVMGDRDWKAARVMKLFNLSEKDALDLMNRTDKKRRDYHNSFCEYKWGDSRNYDLCMNSSKLGVEESVRILSQYIDARKENE